MYVEPSGRKKPRDPWSFRQTGVEHKYDAKMNRSVFIVLHPKERSTAQHQLEEYAGHVQGHSMARHPLNVHLTIISSQMNHWQEHMEDLAESLQDIVC